MLKSKERFKSRTHDVHFLGHVFLYKNRGFIHWRMCLGRCMIDTEKPICNYAVDLDFYWFCPHSLQAQSKVSIKHLLAAVRVKRGQILPVKTTLFYSFAGLKCTVTIETTLPQHGICKEKLATVLMQQFFLSKCSRKNETRVWLKCYFLYKNAF